MSKDHEYQLGNGRIVETIGVRGKSGAWNHIRPDVYLPNLIQEVEDLQNSIKSIDKLIGRVKDRSQGDELIGERADLAEELLAKGGDLAFFRGKNDVSEFDKRAPVLEGYINEAEAISEAKREKWIE